jgi:hypothetical protein
MSDYALTAGQQQLIIDFLNAGKSVYIEGNDFGYFHKSHAIYSMFGITFVADGAGSNNVMALTGQAGVLTEGMGLNYTYGAAYPDQYVDEFKANVLGGADILCQCQKGAGRLSAFTAGGTYRAMHSSFWFGAMKNVLGTHDKQEVMAAYLRFLSGDSLVLGMDTEVSAASGGTVNMFLETEAAKGNRQFGILGSVTGTSPGFNAGFVTVPLNYDVFTDIVILFWNTPVFENFLGTLDGKGRASAALNATAIDPVAVGVTLDFAYILANPIDFASNPAPVTIVP